MTEKLTEQPSEIFFSGTNLTYEGLQSAQKELREKGRPTIPYINMSSNPGYGEAIKVVQELGVCGLEGGANRGLGGVTIFIDSEDDFNSLKEFLEHYDYDIDLPR